MVNKSLGTFDALQHISCDIILDRHHAWQSLDPTLDIWSDFVKKKKKALNALCNEIGNFVHLDKPFEAILYE